MWLPKRGGLKSAGKWQEAPLSCNAAFLMLHCSFSLAAAQLLVKTTSTLQKSECCSATSAVQHSENCSATSVFACGTLEGWGVGLPDPSVAPLMAFFVLRAFLLRKGVCRNQRGICPNRFLGELFLVEFFLGHFPWKQKGENPPRRQQQNPNQSMEASRPKSTLQGSGLEYLPKLGWFPGFWIMPQGRGWLAQTWS